MRFVIFRSFCLELRKRDFLLGLPASPNKKLKLKISSSKISACFWPPFMLKTALHKACKHSLLGYIEGLAAANKLFLPCRENSLIVYLLFLN